MFEDNEDDLCFSLPPSQQEIEERREQEVFDEKVSNPPPFFAIDAQAFYASSKWCQRRRDMHRHFDRKGQRGCMCCGNKSGDMQIDHIHPISKRPYLALEKRNLQRLCHTCNRAKSNKNTSDYRSFYQRNSITEDYRPAIDEEIPGLSDYEAKECIRKWGGKDYAWGIR
jgi:hypothetical protein